MVTMSDSISQPPRMNEAEQLKEVIQREAQEWATGFIQARVAYLSRQVSKSGVLTSSMGFEIDQQARKDAVQLLIGFEEYGRFIDMKPTAQDKWGRQAIERIKEWVRRVGPEKFEAGFIRRYKRLPYLEGQFLNRIAWGIAVKRSYGKYRRRRWWNKSKTAGLTELYNQVAAALPATVAEQVKNTLKT